ncbi:MAG TPA: hypothetical protein VGI46_01865 [Candidatus Acidoferrum sp.]|jgi:hypothetical protein
MTRTGFAILLGAMFAAGASTQTSASPQTPATSSTPSASAQAEAVTTLPSGTALNAQLNSSVDSKKAKVGDKVEARTTEELRYGGKAIVPLGAKLEGHVTEATARSKGDNGSTLSIEFDKAILKKGEEIPLNLVILAVAPPQSDFSGGAPSPGSDPISDSGGAAAGGSPLAASRPQPSPSNYPGGAASSTSAPTGTNSSALPANSRGIYGLKDLKLMEASSNGSQKTVITSDGKNVHLGGGTRLLLVSKAELPTAASK